MPLLSLSQSPGHRHLDIARRYVGVTEVTRNSSPEIDRMLAYVGLRPGTPYCAAFVSYVISKAGATFPTVRSGLASHFITARSIRASDVLIGIRTVPSGSIVIWRRGNTIFGHAGFTESWHLESGRTIEANTSSGNTGSQSDGDGIYQRTRRITPGAMFRIVSFTPVKY